MILTKIVFKSCFYHLFGLNLGNHNRKRVKKYYFKETIEIKYITTMFTIYKNMTRLKYYCFNNLTTSLKYLNFKQNKCTVKETKLL